MLFWCLCVYFFCAACALLPPLPRWPPQPANSTQLFFLMGWNLRAVYYRWNCHLLPGDVSSYLPPPAWVFYPLPSPVVVACAYPYHLLPIDVVVVSCQHPTVWSQFACNTLCWNRLPLPVIWNLRGTVLCTHLPTPPPHHRPYRLRRLQHYAHPTCA